MAFVCLSPTRFVDNDKSDAVARGESKEEVQVALNELDFGGVDKLVLCLPGGGIAARGFGRCPEMAVEGCFIAVLSGSLQNYAYLVRKYCLEELSLPTTISLEAIRDLTPVRETALLCKLYERLGTGMLTKLRGKFAFCLFDSSTMKVLAARDSSGSVPLVAGETSNGFLFVASGETLPRDVQDVKEIDPGQFIYGWRTSAVKYANPLDVVEKSAAEAVDAAAAALKGIKLQELPERENTRRTRSHSDRPQRRRATSSDPYTRAQHMYAYNPAPPDVQSWHQPMVTCPNPAVFKGACYPTRGAYAPVYSMPGDGYGAAAAAAAYREPRHMVDTSNQPRIRRSSLEPNWRPNAHESQYHSRGLSPDASRQPVYVTSPAHHDRYQGHPTMMGYASADMTQKKAFKMKKGSRQREERM